MICENLSVQNGVLYFGGAKTTDLVKKYGSPLYAMDEARIRHNCRTYAQAMKTYFGENALPLYASKAASFKRIYTICAQEGMGTDVVSMGEIYTASQAGFPMEKAYFHSNGKTDEDVRFAMDHGVGYFVVDNEEELLAINHIAGQRGIRQKIILRLTPGIDPHTFDAVSTGKVDSKFGVSIETGQAKPFVELALAQPNIQLEGYHCHVGSQVFDSDVFIRAAEIMLTFSAQMRDALGYTAQILDLGGGYGVRYVESDPTIDIALQISLVAQQMRAMCAEKNLPMPAVRLEPGRSIAADAGLTLYTAGNVKRIPGYKNYLTIDGGMTDNPRYALYGSAYTVYVANKMEEPRELICTIAGRCCESGDLIQENVALPASVTRGDIVAVLTTGAYNYAMASNYNRVGRLPIVMVNQGSDYLAVRRETVEDIIRNDV